MCCLAFFDTFSGSIDQCQSLLPGQKLCRLYFPGVRILSMLLHAAIQTWVSCLSLEHISVES